MRLVLKQPFGVLWGATQRPRHGSVARQKFNMEHFYVEQLVYPYGSEGQVKSDRLAEHHGVRWSQRAYEAVSLHVAVRGGARLWCGAVNFRFIELRT